MMVSKYQEKNKKYSLAFKLNVLNFYLTGEMSYQSLANELKVNNPSVITRWVIDFREKGVERLKPKKRERISNMAKDSKKKSIKKSKSKKEIDELEKLKEENYYLKMEVEILKKRFNSLK